jgi:hypothetical protein
MWPDIPSERECVGGIEHAHADTDADTGTGTCTNTHTRTHTHTHTHTHTQTQTQTHMQSKDADTRHKAPTHTYTRRYARHFRRDRPQHSRFLRRFVLGRSTHGPSSLVCPCGVSKIPLGRRMLTGLPTTPPVRVECVERAAQ